MLDEPTSSLGRADVEHLFELLRHLKAAGPRHRLYLAFHRRSEDGRGPIHRPSRRPQCRRRRHRLGHTRRHRRADGRAGGRRICFRVRRASRRGILEVTGARAGRRVVHAASRRDLRHRRRARLGAHAPAADAVRARAGDEAGGCGSVCIPARPVHTSDGRRGWGCSARTARRKGWR